MTEFASPSRPHSFGMGPSLLFCPADRPERFAKAADRADAVILDLEDAVAPDAKAEARRNLAETPLDPERTIVRVNSADSAHFEADLEALEATPYRTVMLAKAESAEQIALLRAYRVIALCETAAGVLAAPSIAAQPNTVALMWGAEDLVASLGGTSSRAADGAYRAVALHARSAVLLAAGAYGKAAVDAVYTDIPDLDGLAAESADAVASGFAAKACIHPSQVAAVRVAYTPSDEAVTAARALLAAAAAAGTGVFQYEGKMIDGPILRHAQTVVERGRNAV